MKKQQLLNDLNFLFFGSMLGISYAYGALNNPISIVVLLLMVGLFGYQKYVMNQEPSLNNQLKGEQMKYQKPTGSQVAEMFLNKNPSFSENPQVRKIEEQILQSSPRMKMKRRNMVINQVLNESKDTQVLSEESSLSNVVDFQAFKNKKRSFSPEAG